MRLRKLTFRLPKGSGCGGYLYLGRRAKAALCHSRTDLSGAVAHDRLILDRHVRLSGTLVAIIAAENEKAALKAMKLIKVNIKILEPVLDFHRARTMKF